MPARANVLMCMNLSSEKIGMKSAFGSRNRSRSAPTRSVLQSPPRTNVWTRPPARSVIRQTLSIWMRALFIANGRLVTERLAVASRPGRSGTGSSSARTPTASRCLSLDDGAAAAGRGTLDGFQEGHVAEPGREVGQRAGRAAADRADEVDLGGPAGAILVADGDGLAGAAAGELDPLRAEVDDEAAVVPWNVAWSEAMPLVRADISTTAVTSSGYSTSGQDVVRDVWPRWGRRDLDARRDRGG